MVAVDAGLVLGSELALEVRLELGEQAPLQLEVLGEAVDRALGRELLVEIHGVPCLEIGARVQETHPHHEDRDQCAKRSVQQRSKRAAHQPHGESRRSGAGRGGRQRGRLLEAGLASARAAAKIAVP